MSKVDIKRLDSVTKNDTTATEQINDNFQALQQAIENTVSRDGTVPNYMDADLDLNSYRIINAGAPVEGKDVVTLEYFEEKAGGAIEAAAEAKASASKAASSAQSALVASNNAIGQLAQAEGLLIAAEGQLAETQQYVDAAKADIDATVEAGKQEINTTIDEASMSLSDTIEQAVEDVKTEAVAAAEGAIQGAADTATQIATNQVNDYTVNTVVPQLTTFVENAEADASNAAESAEIAANKATEAGNESEEAKHWAEDARVWAEGEQAEIETLGGELSSKGWALQASNSATSASQSATQANTSETNAKGYADSIEPTQFLNKRMITNCITEIPQDIKLELNDGTLTLKAGSKVYVPNGFEADGVTPKFDKVVISADKTLGAIGTYTGSSLLFFDTVSGKISQAVENTSGETVQPTSGNSNWYDTTNNFVRIYSNGVVNQSSKLSLPIAIVARTNGSWTSIDQVFNGFGYIGSTVFTLPGVKGLIPDGRNADGSLKNIEFTVNGVKTSTETTTNNYKLLMTAYTVGNSSVSAYDENNNYNYNTVNKEIQKLCVAGTFTRTNGVISNFMTKTAFHAVDRNDSSWIAQQAMPSGKYIDLTLGASGSTYTAPANGWLFLDKSAGSGQYIEFIVKGSDNNGLGYYKYAYASGNQSIQLLVPIEKGRICNVQYTATGTTNAYRFIYAEGEN